MASICPAIPPNSLLHQPVSAKLHYLLTGTFNTVFLYLLAFNPATSTLSIHAKVLGEGPHQFWALNERRDRAYATTWANPPTLSSWEVLEGGAAGVKKINTVPITATSSYIQVSPVAPRIYSAGGPTGEVHDIDTETGGFGTKLQELLYVPEDELAKADKTRVALRYGSHGIDLSLARRQAFVPHLGHNSIFIYNIEDDGLLTLTADWPSFGDGADGPRHVVPSASGHKLYVVTEHTSYVDVYLVRPNSLIHLQRLSIIPLEKEPSRLSYRGDTLRFSQSGHYLYATTRGKTSSIPGFVSVFSVSPDGSLRPEPLDTYETATSGGKANAVEAFPFHSNDGDNGEKDWIALTDDQDGWVWILEWDGVKLLEIAGVRLGEEEEGEGQGVGASHAVWLS